MAIIINIIDGSQDPNRGDTEKHAGLSINRDEQLGWRAKLTAMPSKRELMRCVSDCPLAIAENVLLWSKRWGWKVKLHPNSVSLKQLMREVKSYTPSGNPDTVILQGAMLLKNFAPIEMQQSPGLPDFSIMLNKAQVADQTPAVPQPQPHVQKPLQKPVQQQQPAQPAQPVQPAQPPAASLEQPPEPRTWVGDGAAKMQRTQDRYEHHMTQVHATVAHNEAKQKQAVELAKNLEAELADIDAMLSEAEEEHVEIPTKFKSKKEALKWAIDLGCFEAEKEASETYDEVKKESGVKNLQEFTPVWAETCIGIMSA